MNFATITVETSHDPHTRLAADTLLEKKYLSRGYTLPPWHDDPHSTLLLARHHHRPCGTLTLTIGDAPHARQTYPHEVELLSSGAQLVELTRLAIDAPRDNNLILAALFEAAWREARQQAGLALALIEVNPRHARFYARRFGFQTLGEERMCLRANAPCVLLALDMARRITPPNRARPPIGSAPAAPDCQVYS